MMPSQLIEASVLPPPKKDYHLVKDFLEVSEFFYDTIQGEGIYVGHPATFLRLKGCVLNCSYCDTRNVWRYGEQYYYNELLDMVEGELLTKFYQGQHLVITGGSPLYQQTNLIGFLEAFKARFKFLPFIEIENECVIKVKEKLQIYIDCWNNSPKLSNSGIPLEKRYKPTAIYATAKLKNSWFKFVITNITDWNEIYSGYLSKGLIGLDQVILMAKGETRDDLLRNQKMVVELAIEMNVKYSPREHIMLWDNKTGI